jgi:hypothetical protein
MPLDLAEQAGMQPQQILGAFAVVSSARREALDTILQKSHELKI